MMSTHRYQHVDNPDQRMGLAELAEAVLDTKTSKYTSHGHQTTEYSRSTDRSPNRYDRRYEVGRNRPAGVTDSYGRGDDTLLTSTEYSRGKYIRPGPPHYEVHKSNYDERIKTDHRGIEDSDKISSGSSLLRSHEFQSSIPEKRSDIHDSSYSSYTTPLTTSVSTVTKTDNNSTSLKEPNVYTAYERSDTLECDKSRSLHSSEKARHGRSYSPAREEQSHRLHGRHSPIVTTSIGVNSDSLGNESDVSSTEEEIDWSSVRAFGPGLQVVPVKQETYFVLKPLKINPSRVTTRITAPSKNDVPVETKKITNGIRVEYTPREVGTYKVKIVIDGNQIINTPRSPRAYDANAINISEIKDGFTGEAVEFSVDATHAGFGNIEIAAKNEFDVVIPSIVNKSERSSKFTVSFVPPKPGRYYVDVKFNEQPLADSPFTCIVSDHADKRHDSKPVHLHQPWYSEERTKSHLQDRHHDHTVERDEERAVGVAPEDSTRRAHDEHYRDTRTTGYSRETFKKDQISDRMAATEKRDYPEDRHYGRTDKLARPVEERFTEATRRRRHDSSDDELPGRTTVAAAHRPGDEKWRSDLRSTGISYGPSLEDKWTDESNYLEERRKLNSTKTVTYHYEPAMQYRKGVSEWSGSSTKESVRHPAHAVKTYDRYEDKWYNDRPTERGTSGYVREEKMTKTGGVVKSAAIVRDADDHSDCVIQDRDKHGGWILKESPLPDRVAVNRPTTFTVRSEAPSDVWVTIKDPDDEEVSPTIKQSNYNDHLITFTPKKVGEYNVLVKLGQYTINGGPITCNAYDAGAVTVSQVPVGLVDSPVKFIVDAAGAGLGTLEVVVNGGRIESQAVPIGHNRFEVSFVPKEPIRHQIDVRFNGEPATGSPFMCNVSSEVEVDVTGQALDKAAINETAEIFVDTKGYPAEPLEVLIKDNSGNRIPAKINELAQSTYRVEFMPETVGSHKIDVRYAGESAKRSPWTCHVFSIDNVRVSEIDGDEVGKPCQFTVDAIKAGAGDMEIVVSADDKNIPNDVKTLGQAKFGVSFIPKLPKMHKAIVRFNGEIVPDCPKYVRVRDVSTAVAAIHPVGTHPGHRRVGSSDSSGDEHTDKIERVKPKEAEVDHEKDHVGMVAARRPSSRGSDVSDSSTEQDANIPIAQGEGLSYGIVGRPAEFSLKAKDLKGDIKMTVQGPNSRPTPKVEQLGKGHYKIAYNPTEIGEHVVKIAWNNQELKGSPFRPLVTDLKQIAMLYPGNLDDGGRLTLVVGEETEVIVNTGNAGPGKLTADANGPSGFIPVDIKRAEKSDRVTFTPTQEGDHFLHLFYNKHPIPDTPLVGRAIRKEPPVHETVGLSGASHEEVQQTYKTTKEHYIGPTIVTESHERPTLPEAHGEGLERGIIHRAAVFIVETQGLKGDMKVTVQGPNSKPTPSAEKKGESVYAISYEPQECGRHVIQISLNGQEIDGSPFHPLIVDPTAISFLPPLNLKKQKKIPLVVDEKKDIAVNTNRAGSGTLTADVQGPDGRVPTGIRADPEKATLSFIPRAMGNYYIYLYYNGYPIPETPLVGTASRQPVPSTHHAAVVAPSHRTTSDESEPEEHERRVDKPAQNGHVQNGSAVVDGMRIVSAEPIPIVLRGEGLREAWPDRMAEFNIDGSQANKGKPTVKLFNQRTEIPIMLEPLERNIYRASYTPILPGKYDLYITWDGKSVRGSPFKVNVSAIGDAAKVTVGCDSLKLGVVDRDAQAVVDVKKAGPGKLTAQCIGPSQKSAYCELSDGRDGSFILTIRPKEPGRNTVLIKYNNEHVPGSPYAMFVSAAPDASKVRVAGPGIESGILSSFQSNFVVDTKGAGAGQLTVRVRGPKGAFNVEMDRDRDQNRHIKCKYDPLEPGDYQIDVKWSGEHVPGSPFTVIIFDTQEELDRHKLGQQVSPYDSSTMVGRNGFPMLPPPDLLSSNNPIVGGTLPRYSGPRPMRYGPPPPRGQPGMLALPPPPARGGAHKQTHMIEANGMANGYRPFGTTAQAATVSSRPRSWVGLDQAYRPPHEFSSHINLYQPQSRHSIYSGFPYKATSTPVLIQPSLYPPYGTYGPRPPPPHFGGPPPGPRHPAPRWIA